MRLAAPPRSALASQDAFAGWVGGEAGVERGVQRLQVGDGDERLGHGRVHAHDQPLVLVERARLVQDRLRYADLADVVEQEPVAQAVVGGQVGVDDLCERGGVVMGAVEMGAGGGVLGLDHEGQRLHHVQVRLLELAQRLLQLVQVSSRWIHAGTFPRESRWTTSSRASGEYGLARYASAPAAWAATRSLSRSCSDRM